MSEATASEALHRQLGLTDDELAAIVELLDREPTELELAMVRTQLTQKRGK